MFAYYQEGADPDARDAVYTNRALVRCWEDQVPVGVLRQTKGKPNPTYDIVGVALVAGWDGGYFFFEGFAADGACRGKGAAGEVEFLTRKAEEDAEKSNAFNAEDGIAGRERVLAEIVRRRGQPKFRKDLLDAYGGTCAISGCAVLEALEAAHIIPYRGEETNHTSNGLLLRADLHTLFDLGLVTIDVSKWTVIVAGKLLESSFGGLSGTALHLPLDSTHWPDIEALASHREWSGL